MDVIPEARPTLAKTAARTRAGNGSSQDRLRARLGRLLLGILLVVVPWSLVTGLGWVKPVILPAPLAVLRAFPEVWLQDHLWVDMFQTLKRVAGALAIALAAGVPIGLWLGYHQKVYRVVEGPIHALRSLPATVLFPLLLIVPTLGASERSVVALATYSSLLVVMINTIAGAALANPHRLYQARLLGMNGFEVITQILFWESLPHILAGARVAIGYALALVIAIEMFIGVIHTGLGRRIFDFQASSDTPQMYAAILLTGLLGVCVNGILSLLERRLLRWMPKAE